MEHFSYSFIGMLFHSFWQLALLLSFYRMLIFFVKQSDPTARRNSLYIVLLVQLLTSVGTFAFYYSGIKWGMLNENLFNIASLPPSLIQIAAPYLASGYGVVLFYKFGTYILRWERFTKNTQETLSKVPAATRLFTNLKAAELGISRKVSIWYSTAVHSPVVYGFIKPVILLPFSLATQLSTQETETLLIHELTHIRNNDYILNWLLIFAENIYFFNPLMKILSANIKMEREKACDIQVLQFKYTPLEYAGALLSVARYRKTSLSFQLAAVTEKSLLLQRIQFFSVYPHQQKQKGLRIPLTLAMTLFLFTLFGIARTLSTPGESAGFELNFTTQKLKLPHVTTSSQSTAADRSERKKTTSITTNVNLTTAVGKKIVRRKQLSQSMTDNAVQSTELSTQFPPTTVAYKADKPRDSARQVIINEESSNGEVLTRAYKVKLVNGEWVSEPLWVLTEKHPRRDSVFIKRDSAFKLVPIVQ